MSTRSFCGMAPLLFRRKSSGIQAVKSSDVSKKKKEVKELKVEKSRGWATNFILMIELRKKILIFRDIIDLPPCDGSASINELLLGTTRDLHKLFPEIIPSIRMSELEGTSLEQALAYFCGALRSIGDSWMTNDDWTTKFQYNAHGGMEQLVKVGLEALECVIKAATERFDMMDEEDLKNDYSPQADAFDRISVESYSDKSPGCLSPITPTSVLPEVTSKSTQLREFASVVYAPSLLQPLRVQALGKLNPIDVKRLSFHMFPHAVAQDSKTMIEQIKTADEPKPETEVKSHSELMETCTSEELENCLATNDTDMVEMSYMTEEKTGDAGNQAAALLQTPEDLTKEAAGDLLLPALQPQLPPNAASTQAPPPPPPTPPPSLPKLSLNVNVPAMTPPPPPPPLPQPKLQQIITVTIPSPPAPPPPPPPSSKMSTNVTAPPPPPPPMMPIRGSLPCPPPPPPMMPIKGSVPCPPPPPPMMPTIGSLPCPPPPPPMMPIKGSLPCPPPPPPMMPMKGSLPYPPPPPPMMPIKGSLPCPPPPPPMMSIKGSLPCPPPPMPPTNGGAPPPPPLGAARSLRPKKAATKLKRSSHMGNLYRVLKGKVEGSCLTGKSAHGRKSQSGSSGGGSQLGMADALAEMTKRSSYFLQIEEDAQKYAKSITELKVAITSFQTKDMSELLKFHKYVESQLENLTDESQVLARFEGFPTKKLEALRMAAALYLKLDAILTNLANWKIVAPLNQLLDKVESYFNKIKGELDALERTKDEESKRFQSNNIHFDFNILVKIKESMVDVSSGCMELALKEGREAKATANVQTSLKKGVRAIGSAKMLWKAFQFAFRVYTFAGGQDDRADYLTRELAQEIETDQ